MENTYTTGSLLDRPAWNQWNLVVEQLMRRCLSVEGDKLLAVSAVAVYIYRLFESRDEARAYLAGLFVDPGLYGIYAARPHSAFKSRRLPRTTLSRRCYTNEHTSAHLGQWLGPPQW